MPIGEALRQAKLKLVAEMHERQGFLDGEDQKTLISFVLYGDPLYSTSRLRLEKVGSKAVARTVERPKSMKTVCALGGPDLMTDETGAPSYDRINTILAQYLPTMADAKASLRTQHSGCDHDDHCCPSQQLGTKSLGQEDAYVVTLSKQVKDGNTVHPYYARLTLDQSGKVSKLAVSR